MQRLHAVSTCLLEVETAQVLQWSIHVGTDVEAGAGIVYYFGTQE